MYTDVTNMKASSCHLSYVIINDISVISSGAYFYFNKHM